MNLLRRRPPRVALVQLNRMVSFGDTAKRRSCFTLTTRRDNHHLIARKCINRVHINQFGQILQITGGL